MFIYLLWERPNWIKMYNINTYLFNIFVFLQHLYMYLLLEKTNIGHSVNYPRQQCLNYASQYKKTFKFFAYLVLFGSLCQSPAFGVKLCKSASNALNAGMKDTILIILCIEVILI